MVVVGWKGWLGAVFAAGLLGACSSPGTSSAPAGDDSDGGTATRPDTRESEAPAPGLVDLLTDVSDDGSLIAGLHSGDAHTRRVAARALGNFPGRESGAALLARAGMEEDPGVLVELAFALGQWGDPSIAGAISPALRHEDEQVRATALEALGKTHDDRHTSSAVNALDDPSPTVRGAAALALFRFDGRRYDHERQATESSLAARDQALARAALQDDHAGVRWRAIYALGSVQGRSGLATTLELCLRDDDPLGRVFALRGLAALEKDDLGSAAASAASLMEDTDERVAVEAVTTFGLSGASETLAETALRHRSSLGRAQAVKALAARLDDMADERAPFLAILGQVAEEDADATTRRVAREALCRGPDAGQASFFLQKLVRSGDWRDREVAGTLLAEGIVEDDFRLEQLLDDSVTTVRAAALPALRERHIDGWKQFLMDALATDDPALLAAAGETALVPIGQGVADPALVLAVADAVDRCDVDFRLSEARANLRAALSLPEEIDPIAAVPERPVGRLIDRLLAEDDEAGRDPHPTVALETDRGRIVIELDRRAAPRHVSSFLSLTEAGTYDGLDFHRVVPDFVLQGLDPRGDGWGTGGRRVPDEYNTISYVAGTVGMPAAGTPDTGGCQIFITHVPTPHLDGRYTAFGRVVDGLDAVIAMRVGDRVRSVRRIDNAP